ncbi:MAG: hypothetical protein J1E00_00360 [Oscillospiraceae bacterium]|nr:hypothetical protein [Oscillospiraceae bacterium]
MTEKELRKLKRGDFLQLLLAQSKEMAALQARLEETVQELTQLRASNERLNAQNELIEELKGNLDSKNATISELRQEIEALKSGKQSEPEVPPAEDTPEPEPTQKPPVKRTAKQPAASTPKKKRPAYPAKVAKLINKVRKRGKR